MATCYRVPVQEEFEWQQPVINMSTTTPPAVPSRGDRYVVAAGATGAWSGEDDNIAYCSNATGPVWEFTDVKEGMIVWDESRDRYYHYDGSNWVWHGRRSFLLSRRYALLVGAP